MHVVEAARTRHCGNLRQPRSIRGSRTPRAPSDAAVAVGNGTFPSLFDGECFMSPNQTGVVLPESTDYVLPVPPPKAGEVVVVASHRDAAASLRRGGEVARTLGDRFLALAESQQLFADELRQRLGSLDTAIAEDSRAQLKGAVREILGVLDWCDQVQSDLVRDCRLAAAGAEPVDVAEVAAIAAAERQSSEQPVVVTGTSGPWWGAASLLLELLQHALDLVAERTQGIGARFVEVDQQAAGIQVWVHGVGEPADQVDAQAIERFRRAAQAIGAIVRPDALGPGGVGMVLVLPVAS
ncbi:MAG: hypothetical protein JNK15_05065 [Planctomycetes bacterium]|nr:hypothetical protein [Planctomycetota bacterium]